MTPEQFGGMLKSRRTVNFFRPEPVPRELLLDAVEVARWAPNHKLTEPWHFYLLGEESVEQVRGLIAALKAGERDEKARQAVRSRLDAIPSWFVLTCRLSPDKPVRQQEDYAACACAVQNLSLYLWQAGVGVKWTSGQVIRDEGFYRLLDIDMQREIVMGLFWCGYPADNPPAQKRRGIEEICTELP
ncbi:MAG: nitroreductase [Gammaproteobacteria bacterium]